MKKTGALFLILALSLSLFGFQPTAQKVFDNADLLTEEMEEQLAEEAVDAAHQLNMDIIFLTVSDTGGKSTEKYTDDFCDKMGFGYEGPNGSFVLICIDMDNRIAYIKTGGEAIKQITDSEIDSILDMGLSDLKRETGQGYMDACLNFLEGVKSYAANKEVAKDIKSEGYDSVNHKFVVSEAKPTFWNKVLDPVPLLIRLVAAAAIGGIVVFFMYHGSKASMTVNARTYQKGDIQFKNRSDQFTHTTVVKRKIEKQSSGGGGGGSSSIHTSDGGNSYGGGGKSF